MSVANPGIIKSKAANAMAAPEIISYAGVSCLCSWDYAQRKGFTPSYLSSFTPVTAANEINRIALEAQILAANFMESYTSTLGTTHIHRRTYPLGHY